MKHIQNWKTKSRALALTGIVAVGLVGSVLVGAGVKGEAPPPSPLVSEAIEGPAAPSEQPSAITAPEAGTKPAKQDPASPLFSSTPGDLILKKSQPTRLTIPSIDVDTDLMNVGLQDDGTIGVPPLLTDSPAGWFDRGPTPGEKGPAVILGHVTALNQLGPAVFFKLGALHKNDEISVTREDGKVAVFTVTRVEQTPKPDFSSMDTYGNTDDAQLRLITCGGTFNKTTARHADNIVVYAKLTSTHPA